MDGELVTVIDYVRAAATCWTSTHTGPGSASAAGTRRQGHPAALEDIRAQGWQVHPICPFTVDYLDTHPEYADLRV